MSTAAPHEQLRSADPFSGHVVAEYEELSDADLQKVLQRLNAGYEVWSRLPLEKRCFAMQCIAREIFR